MISVGAALATGPWWSATLPRSDYPLVWVLGALFGGIGLFVALPGDRLPRLRSFVFCVFLAAFGIVCAALALAPTHLAPDGSYADPSVRLSEWVKQFGRNGVLQSICDTSFRPAMMLIADEIGRVLGPKCVTGVFGDKDPNAPGTQYDCVVTEHLLDSGTGKTTDSMVPACAENGNVKPCWHLDTDATCRIPAGAPAGTQSLKLVTDRDGMAPNGLSSTIACALVVPQP